MIHFQQLVLLPLMERQLDFIGFNSLGGKNFKHAEAYQNQKIVVWGVLKKWKEKLFL